MFVLETTSNKHFQMRVRWQRDLGEKHWIPSVTSSAIYVLIHFTEIPSLLQSCTWVGKLWEEIADSAASLTAKLHCTGEIRLLSSVWFPW